MGARSGGTGLLYGLADTSNGDPVYGYDLSVAADTASNVLAVNAFNRVAQLADLAGDAAGAATQRARAAQLAAAVKRLLRRPDGVYVDGVDANGAQSTHASQEANALALAYGVVPAARRGGGGRLRGQPRHRRRAQPRARAAARPGRGGLPDAMVRTLTDPSIPGWAHIVAGGRDLHLGDVDAERPDRGLHVARLGLVRAGRHAGDPARGVAHGARPRRHGPGRRGAAVGRPGAGAGSVPTIAGPVAVSWQRRGGGHGVGADGAGQRVGPGAAARRRIRRASARAAWPRRERPGVAVQLGGGGTAVLSVGSGSYRFTTA